jgi:hypothetical protein
LRNASLQSPTTSQLTYPEDEDGRHARCVSRNFSPRPGRLGVGERRARVHRQRRRDGKPRVRASAGGRLRGGGRAPLGGAPWRRSLALLGSRGIKAA